MTRRQANPDPSAKKTVPPPQPGETVGRDDRAEREAVAVEEGTLSHIAHRNQHRRSEQLKDAWNFSLLVIMIIGGAAVAASMIVLAFHFLAPTEWCFLEDARLVRLKEIMLSGLLTGAVLEIRRRVQ